MTKRRADDDFDAAVHRASTPHDNSASSAAAKRNPHGYAAPKDGSSIAMMNRVHIRAFGLEDRAEAVIAMGKDNWSLANLSKWRNDSLSTTDAVPGTAADTQSSGKEYLRQRQRAFMKQCLAASKTNTTQ